MAKRKDEGKASEGFRIPIQDANEAEEAEEAEKPEELEETETTTTGADGESEAAAVVDNETVEDESPALEDEATDDDSPAADEAEAEYETAADDIVAEAEAVVDQAAAAAEDPEALRKEAADWQDRYMRLHAEWDTYRRRMSEQRAEEKLRATEKLVEDLLPVLDDFERTVQYADENGETGLLDGVKAVQTKLVDALRKSGLVIIDPAGEPYDALEAQAVATVPDDEAFDETVRDVYQKGYKMGKKVLRPAMVTITTGGPRRPEEEEDASA